MTQTLGSRQAYDTLERELGVFTRRARAAAYRLSRAVHPELDSAAYGLLSYLRDHGLARPSDLAGFVGVGKATISRQVKVLEDLGWWSAGLTRLTAGLTCWPSPKRGAVVWTRSAPPAGNTSTRG